MIRALLIAAAGFTIQFDATPALAQAEARTEAQWRNEASDIVVPRAIGNFELTEERPLAADGTDTILQFRSDEDSEVYATVYVYRASQPNAALWFERALVALTLRADSTGVEAVGEPESLTVAGAPAPNGMAQTLRGSYQGFRTTGLAVAQIGEWIVKLRISSPSDDPNEIAALLRTFAAAIGHAGEAATVHPLERPEPCGDAANFDGSPVEPTSATRATAILEGLVIYSRARGARDGLAVDPASWCELTPPEFRPFASLYRMREGFDGGWTMLFGDAGGSIVSYPLEMASGEASVGLYANRTSNTMLVGLYDGAPSIEAALTAAQPVLMGRSEGLGAISVQPNRR